MFMKKRVVSRFLGATNGVKCKSQALDNKGFVPIHIDKRALARKDVKNEG
jgi:hypothetical protein